MKSVKGYFPASSALFINIIGIIAVFIVLKELQDIFIPLLVAYFLFLTFSPLNRLLGRKRFPDWLVILIDIFILLVVLASISSVFINSVYRLGLELPVYEKKLNAIVSSTASSWGVEDPYFTNFNIALLLKGINYKLLAGNFFFSSFTFLGSLLFVLFFFIFIFTGYDNIYNAIKSRYLYRKRLQIDASKYHENEALKEPGDDKVFNEESLQNTFNEISQQVQRYITTKFFISLFTGIVEGLIIWFFGVDFAIVWAVSIFLLNFIPNIGSLLGLVPPVVVCLIQFGSIGRTFFLGLTLVIVDNIIGNFVEPKIFGEKLGLNPLIVLLALLLWGYIWGIPGALLSVPLTSIIKIIISRSDSPNLKFLNNLMSG